VTATVATVGVEWTRVWRRGSAPVPRQADRRLAFAKRFALMPDTDVSVRVPRPDVRLLSNRLGCMGSLLLSAAVTVVLVIVLGVIQL